MKRLDLSEREAVVLALLAMTGATAFDTEAAMVTEIGRRFQVRFGVQITGPDVVRVLDKIKSLISRDEDVVVDDG